MSRLRMPTGTKKRHPDSSKRSPQQCIMELWHQFGMDVIMAIMAFIAAGLLVQVSPYEHYFVEGDAELSHPYRRETVPGSLLLLLCWAIPALLLTVIQLTGLTKMGVPLRSRSNDVYLVQVGFHQTIAFTLALTQLLKVICGRPRPNFYQYCKYSSPAIENQATGTSQRAFASALPGSYRNCTAKVTAVWDAHSSFPSGHSSLAFAGMTYFALFANYCVTQWGHQSLMPLRIIFTFIPLSLASFIASSRTRDYFHFFDDILAGSLLGFLIGIFFHFHHYGSRLVFNESSFSPAVTSKRSDAGFVIVPSYPEKSERLDMDVSYAPPLRDDRAEFAV